MKCFFLPFLASFTGLVAGQAGATVERPEHKAFRAKIQSTKIPRFGTARTTKLLGRHYVHGIGSATPVHDLPSSGRRIPNSGQFVPVFGRLLNSAVLCYGRLWRWFGGIPAATAKHCARFYAFPGERRTQRFVFLIFIGAVVYQPKLIFQLERMQLPTHWTYSEPDSRPKHWPNSCKNVPTFNSGSCVHQATRASWWFCCSVRWWPVSCTCAATIWSFCSTSECGACWRWLSAWPWSRDKCGITFVRRRYCTVRQTVAFPTFMVRHRLSWSSNHISLCSWVSDVLLFIVFFHLSTFSTDSSNKLLS